MRRFWEMESLHLENSKLRVSLLEMAASSDDTPESISISGMEIGGFTLKAGDDAARSTIVFSKVVEFRAVPEQLSWPIYEDGEELLPCILYKKSGLFFYGRDCAQDCETVSNEVGWVKAIDLECYIVHSESLDIYVLSAQAPIVSQTIAQR